LIKRLASWPDKKHQRDDQLGRDQKVGQHFMAENRIVVHGLARCAKVKKDAGNPACKGRDADV
jgi:hypothetical protein